MPMYQKICKYEGCRKPFTTKFQHVESCSVSCGRKTRTKMSQEDVMAYVLGRIEKPHGEDGCWIWTGSYTTTGYGYAFVRGTRIKAPRLVYELLCGHINPTQNVLHDPILCNTPACVNPAHLRLGSQRENAHDRKKAGTQVQGERQHRARLKEYQIPIMRQMYNSGEWSQQEIAKHFDVHFVTIHDVVRGETWKHVAASDIAPHRDDRKKLSDDDVAQIREARQCGASYANIAEVYNISETQISDICRNLSRKIDT